MNRRQACLAQAAVFREQAEVDPAHRDRWVAEAMKWLERAAAPSSPVRITFEAIGRSPEEPSEMVSSALRHLRAAADYFPSSDVSSKRVTR